MKLTITKEQGKMTIEIDDEDNNEYNDKHEDKYEDELNDEDLNEDNYEDEEYDETDYTDIENFDKDEGGFTENTGRPTRLPEETALIRKVRALTGTGCEPKCP